jgi:zinc protease
MRFLKIPARFAAALAALLLLPCAAAAQSQDAARSAWGFDRTDLAPHPGVRFGVLPNGMRYALMRNARPAGGLSARLHIGAGARVEGPRERGFMHLVEHMIFHGSANLPHGALPLMLRQRGLRRWSDFNAFTDFTQTVYRIDLAQSDLPARQTALTVLREVAGHLRFGGRAVEGAKRDVRAEIRARDTIRDTILAEQSALFVHSLPADAWYVAGTEKSVARAKGEALRRLYQRHYVPVRATLVLVGDFDPAAAEAEIVERFSDWAGGAASDPPRPVVTVRQGVIARLFVDRAAPTSVMIAAADPLPAPGDGAANRDDRYLDHLASEILNRRLARLAPRFEASSAIYDHFSAAHVASIELSAPGRDWRAALEAAAAELRRALDEGFSQAELAEQLDAGRRSLAASAAPRTNAALADAIVDSVERRFVFTAPGSPVAAAAYLDRIRLDAVNAAFRAAWASPARLIFVSHDRRIPGGEAAIAAAWTASR